MRNSVAIEDIKRIMDIRDIPVDDFLCGSVPMQVDLSQQKTGFDNKVFMVCPRCGCRRVKLYTRMNCYAGSAIPEEFTSPYKIPQTEGIEKWLIV